MEDNTIPDISHLDLTGKIEITKQTAAWGGFSDVSRGILHSETGDIEVAIKALRIRANNTETTTQASSEDRLLKRFYREIRVWQTLDHPNVVPLLGFTMQPDAIPTLISPWYINSNINQYLKSNPQANRLHLIRDVAKGLDYLHSIPIAHGDIKGENVLVNAQGRASLCDFGLSLFLGEEGQISGLANSGSITMGTLRFISPELLEDKPKTNMSDIWAFGCLVMQIMTDQVPYSHITSGVALPLAISRGEPPMVIQKEAAKFSEHQSLWDFVSRSWSTQCHDRPTASDFLTEVPIPDDEVEEGNDDIRTSWNDEFMDYEDDDENMDQNWDDWLTLPDFPHKLYKMLQDPEVERYMYWRPRGDSFVLAMAPQFSHEILLRYFQHSSIRRFVHKLMNYDFRQVDSAPRFAEGRVMVFSHPKFLRDRPELLDDLQENGTASSAMQTATSRGHVLILGGPPIGLRRRPSGFNQGPSAPTNNPDPLMDGDMPTGSEAVPDSERMTVEPNTQFSGAGPADFVMKLYDLLEDAALSDCLFWNPKGKSFTVRDVPRLSQSILPEHFDFLHCTSLVRQLKIYDFQLVKGYSAPTAQGSIMTWEFQHPKFRREHPQLLEEVRMLLAATTSDDSDQSDIALYDGLFDSKSTGRGLLPNFDPPMHRPHNHPLGPSSVGGLSAIRSRRHVTTSSRSDATDIRHRSQILGQLIPIPPPLLPELAAPTPWPVEGLNFGLGDEANRSTDAVTSGHVTPSSDGATDESRSSSSHSDFVHVLHRCLENKQHLEHLSWDPDGKSFTALFSASFKPTVLSTLFQDCSVLFFQEQLRAQGFKELNRTSKSETSDVKSIRFTHRKFRRGRPELLSQVRKGPTITMRARQVGSNENRSTVSSTAVGTDVSMTSTAVASSISSSSRVSAQRKKRSRSPDSE